MEDIIINGYAQVLLGAIGTALTGAVGALWYILWKVVGEKDSLQKEMREGLERNLTKSNEAITNNTVALNAFKEALKNA